ncbi:MAG: DUF2971 domain-containing protein [Spirosomataceae bacterium]
MKFINELKENTEKKEVINEYEKYYGKIEGDITNQIWFIDYISKFYPYYEAVNCPKESEDDFDWQLFFSLIVGSFVSEIELVKPDKLLYDAEQKVDVHIYVENDDKSIKKALNELWGFQIFRLFEIYCEEQINAQLDIATNERYGMKGMYELRLKKIDFISNYNPTFKKLTPNPIEQNDVVYHYTSFNTINEIFKSNSLRACDLKRLNDKKEYKIWFDIFDLVFERFQQKEDILTFEAFLMKIKQTIESYKDYDCYVTCLSKERDLLSQWRAYGDNGQGIAIAFDVNELKDCLYKFNEGDFNLLHGYLEYNYDIVYKDLIEIITKLLRNFVLSNLSVDEYFNRVDNLKHYDDTTRRLFMRMQDLKDSSFFEEKEYRLFWLQHKKDPIKNISTFERNKRIVPFVDLKFGDTKIPIKEIILGPCLTEKEEKKENIIEVLERYGYDISTITISESKLPYRN